MPYNIRPHIEQSHKAYVHGLLKPHVSEEWTPNTDVYADKSGIVVKMELAGVKTNNVEVLFENGFLTVSGRRADPTLANEERDRRFTQAEIEYGRFRRVVRIDVPVDGAKATAQFETGILLIRLPWTETPPKTTVPVTEE